MTNWLLNPLIWLALALAAGVFLWPETGALARMKKRREGRIRTQLEDALKHILAWQERSQTATPESLTGALGLPPRRILRLITKMEARGLAQSVSGGVRLTPKGERLGLHVVRAHRLWERYLADDAGMPLARLHQAAEKAEHGLTPEHLDELEAHLGHPAHDPHGDPIPARDGSVAALDAVPLTDWPADEPARIVHLEDEPAVIFQQILAADLRPGLTVRILESLPERIVISDGENEHRLARAVAANIQVAAARRLAERPADVLRLSDLPFHGTAEVVEIDEQCRGFSRRRLMDLGITPGTKIAVALQNTFGDPRAFRLRGTTIALRKEQAAWIWVRPRASQEEAA